MLICNVKKGDENEMLLNILLFIILFVLVLVVFVLGVINVVVNKMININNGVVVVFLGFCLMLMNFGLVNSVSKLSDDGSDKDSS